MGDVWWRGVNSTVHAGHKSWIGFSQLTGYAKWKPRCCVVRAPSVFKSINPLSPQISQVHYLNEEDKPKAKLATKKAFRIKIISHQPQKSWTLRVWLDLTAPTATEKSSLAIVMFNSNWFLINTFILSDIYMHQELLLSCGQSSLREHSGGAVIMNSLKA